MGLPLFCNLNQQRCMVWRNSELIGLQDQRQLRPLHADFFRIVVPPPPVSMQCVPTRAAAQLGIPAQQIRQYYNQHDVEDDLHQMPVTRWAGCKSRHLLMPRPVCMPLQLHVNVIARKTLRNDVKASTVSLVPFLIHKLRHLSLLAQVLNMILLSVGRLLCNLDLVVLSPALLCVHGSTTMKGGLFVVAT